jgi:hypothetical protein
MPAKMVSFAPMESVNVLQAQHSAMDAALISKPTAHTVENVEMPANPVSFAAMDAAIVPVLRV